MNAKSVKSGRPVMTAVVLAAMPVLTAFCDYVVRVSCMEWDHETVPASVSSEHAAKKTPRMGWHVIGGGTCWRGIIVKTPSRIPIPVGKGPAVRRTLVHPCDDAVPEGRHRQRPVVRGRSCFRNDCFATRPDGNVRLARRDETSRGRPQRGVFRQVGFGTRSSVMDLRGRLTCIQDYEISCGNLCAR